MGFPTVSDTIGVPAHFHLSSGPRTIGPLLRCSWPQGRGLVLQNFAFSFHSLFPPYNSDYLVVYLERPKLLVVAIRSYEPVRAVIRTTVRT